MVDRIAILWDIDGTLLSTARAGVGALESALLSVVGRTIDLDTRPTAGRTDSEIFTAILVDLGIAPETEVIEALLRCYAEDLPAALHRRRGGLLPGVKATLDAPGLLGSCEHMLLTGNFEPCAHAKLAHYGIDNRFTRGWFCRAGDRRESISRRAASDLNRLQRPRRVIIGDTVHDATCAAAAGIPCLGISSDPEVRSAMTVAGARIVWNELPSPSELARTLAEIA